jgi:hypothetical protein
MPDPVRCVRLFADENGESHFEDFETSLELIQYAPPAPALGISEPVEARRFVWLRFPEDWQDAAHPSPRRQLFVALEGEVEAWTSGGDTRIFRPGDRVLMEDTSGKGHGARPVNGEALGIMIALE